jgi:hypothetical protein
LNIKEYDGCSSNTSPDQYIHVSTKTDYFYFYLKKLPFISPPSYIIPWAYPISGWYHDLGLIKGMIRKMPCNNLYVLVRCCIGLHPLYSFILISPRSDRLKE